MVRYKGFAKDFDSTPRGWQIFAIIFSFIIVIIMIGLMISSVYGQKDFTDLNTVLIENQTSTNSTSKVQEFIDCFNRIAKTMKLNLTDPEGDHNIKQHVYFDCMELVK